MRTIFIGLEVEVIVHDSVAAEKFDDEALASLVGAAFQGRFPKTLAWGMTRVVALDGKPRPAVVVGLREMEVKVAGDFAPDSVDLPNQNGSALRVLPPSDL